MARRSQSNFFMFGPDGQALALFPGGILIPAALTPPFPPPDTGKVTWVETAGGALVADISGQSGGPGGSNLLTLRTVSPNQAREVSLQFGVTDAVGTGGAAITVTDAGPERVILGSGQQSDFMQITPGVARKSGILGGGINAAGIVVDGSGFSCVRNSVGDYSITFDPPPFPTTCAPALLPFANSVTATLAARTNTGFRPQFRTVAGALVDVAFSFVAIAVTD